MFGCDKELMSNSGFGYHAAHNNVTQLPQLLELSVYYPSICYDFMVIQPGEPYPNTILSFDDTSFWNLGIWVHKNRGIRASAVGKVKAIANNIACSLVVDPHQVNSRSLNIENVYPTLGIPSGQTFELPYLLQDISESNPDQMTLVYLHACQNAATDNVPTLSGQRSLLEYIVSYYSPEYIQQPFGSHTLGQFNYYVVTKNGSAFGAYIGYPNVTIAPLIAANTVSFVNEKGMNEYVTETIVSIYKFLYRYGKFRGIWKVGGMLVKVDLSHLPISGQYRRIRNAMDRAFQTITNHRNKTYHIIYMNQCWIYRHAAIFGLPQPPIGANKIPEMDEQKQEMYAQNELTEVEQRNMDRAIDELQIERRYQQMLNLNYPVVELPPFFSFAPQYTLWDVHPKV